jgi:hypothetical protein
MICREALAVRVVGEDVNDAALRNAAVLTLSDHASQLAAQRLEARDLGFDVGEDVAGDMIDPGARLIGFVDELEQLADCVERKSELTRMTNERQTVGVRPRVPPLTAEAARGFRHEPFLFIEADRLDFGRRVLG